MASTATASSAWLERTKKRQHGELALLRRPSEAPSIHNSYSTQSTPVSAAASDTAGPSPSSPQPRSAHSSMSTASIRSAHSAPGDIQFDKLQALQLQLRNNTAQMEANQARMQQIQTDDDRMASEIQTRLSEVMALNQRLSALTAMLSRAEKVSKGDF